MPTPPPHPHPPRQGKTALTEEMDDWNFIQAFTGKGSPGGQCSGANKNNSRGFPPECKLIQG